MFDFNSIHPSWLPCLEKALTQIDPNYLQQLSHTHWLPGLNAIFNAFSIDLEQLNYVLLGESPYPREQSANGYAFWDGAVDEIWSGKGLAKTVNRATSLRNIMKMLLLTNGDLNTNDVSQTAIAKLDKSPYVQTLAELFENFRQRGFLLLNASLVLSEQKVTYDAKHWQPFISHVLGFIQQHRPNTKLILFGKIAEQINKFPSSAKFTKVCAEHPYNISFIHNPDVMNFFKPLNLLERRIESET